MSNSIRFLGAALFAWVAVRAVSLGMIPGTQALAFDAKEARPRLPARTGITLASRPMSPTTCPTKAASSPASACAPTFTANR